MKNAAKDSTPENSAIQKLSIVISSSSTLSQRRKDAVRHEKVQSEGPKTVHHKIAPYKSYLLVVIVVVLCHKREKKIQRT